MRILYVNHTAEVSGAERSLLSLLEGLPGSIEARVAAPRGRLELALAPLGIPLTPIAGTSGSLRLHPLHTPKALADMSIAAAQVRRAARAHRAEIVHANSIRAGIVVGLARPRCATVVHVRDCLPPGAVTTATMRLIGGTATVVIANSAYTARSVLAAAPRAQVEVVHNAVDLSRWDPGRIDREAARARLGAPPGRLLLGVVAQLSPWKGQDVAIEALRQIRAAGVDAQLLLVGSAKFVARATRFDNEAYLDGLHALVARDGLEDRVSWLGERDDVPELVRALDILLLPSWEEPFGRALIEAMALEVPVIATKIGGPVEIVEDGREGLLLAPRDAAAWAQAVLGLAADPARRAAMGRAGRARVQEQFTLARHVEETLGVYRRALERRRGAPVAA